MGLVQKEDLYTQAYLESVTTLHEPPRTWYDRLAWWWLLAGGPACRMLACACAYAYAYAYAYACCCQEDRHAHLPKTAPQSCR